MQVGWVCGSRKPVSKCIHVKCYSPKKPASSAQKAHAYIDLRRIVFKKQMEVCIFFKMKSEEKEIACREPDSLDCSPVAYHSGTKRAG